MVTYIRMPIIVIVIDWLHYFVPCKLSNDQKWLPWVQGPLWAVRWLRTPQRRPIYDAWTRIMGLAILHPDRLVVEFPLYSIRCSRNLLIYMANLHPVILSDGNITRPRDMKYAPYQTSQHKKSCDHSGSPPYSSFFKDVATCAGYLLFVAALPALHGLHACQVQHKGMSFDSAWRLRHCVL